MLKIAIYGKGGIGKSTVSANLSQELSDRGLSVIQIGCDPKHDSTRLLLKGRFQETVLQTAKEKSNVSLDDVMTTSDSGVRCIEVGGPEPGVGCAGRGLLTAFDILSRSDIDGLNADLMIYDVLGDVVCGGFAVPMRPENSDVIYIVTSGEFMALYAANNIMRGMNNYSSGGPRLAGLIFNKRGLENEDRYMQDFSEATGVPVIAAVPRSHVFERAEDMNLPVVTAFPDSEAAKAVADIANDTMQRLSGEKECCYPRPLTDIELDNLIKGLRNVEEAKSVREEKPCGCGGGRRRRRICAARGAVTMLDNVTDLNILVHGPESCAFVMSYTVCNHSLREYFRNTDLRIPVDNNIFCTGMTDSDTVTGSIGKLESQIRRSLLERKGPLAVVTTCVPSMIGDNSKAVVERLAEETGRDIRLIDCSGVFTGDALKGREDAIDYLCSMVEQDVLKVPGTVNFVDDGFGRLNYGDNEKNILALFDIFNLKVETKLFYRCSSEQIRNAGKAEYNVLATETERSSDLRKKLESRGVTNYLRPLPSGVRDTFDWIKDTGRRVGMKDAAEKAIAAISKDYDAYVYRMRPLLSGKKVIIITGTMMPVQWAVDTLNDVGMKVVKVGIVRFEEDEAPKPMRPGVNVQDYYSMKDIPKDIEELRPDLILGHSNFRRDPGICNGNLPPETISYQGSYNLIRRVYNLLRAPSASGWEGRRFG